MKSTIRLSENDDSFDITIDKSRYYAHVKFDGEICIENVNNAYLALIHDPLFSYNMNVCNDFTDALILVSVSEIEVHSQFVSQYADQRGSSYKLALVSNETVGTAFLNMYRVKISTSNVDCEQFSSTKNALRWVEQ